MLKGAAPGYSCAESGQGLAGCWVLLAVPPVELEEEAVLGLQIGCQLSICML